MRLIQSSIAAVLSAAIFAPAVHAQTPTPILPPIPIHLQFPEWYAYRYGNSRTGVQPYKSNLSDPAKVGTLKVKWAFPATGALTGGFQGSPIVVNDTVFIGGQNGYFYALEAVTGALKWQYPKASDPPLLGQDPMWKYGIQTAAAFWYRSSDGAVIFGAQDPSLGPVGPHGSYGSARLFALDAKTGALIWKSDRIAEINGDTWGSTSELHQRIAHTYPLIFGTKVYIGIHNTADNPVQVGRVIAVELATGHIDPAFQFRAVGTAGSPPGTRGGGVWNAPAADSAGVYFTTGNTRSDAAGTQSPEPKPNHGLSMLRVDKDTGKIIWAFQPVPYKLDADPDWAAGAAIMSTSCGELVASVQKDGWSYAVNASTGTPGAPSVHWQFPPTGYPFTAYTHGDTDYKRPGAAWNDVFIVTTGGESLVHDGVTAGYGKLQALNACATTEKTRVRWIAEVPNSSNGGYSLGAPTVTGGIIFVGTDKGHLVVLGDPSVVPRAGLRCSNIDYTTSAACIAAGFAIVPIPKVLANVAMPDGGNIAGLRNEAALAKGRVFVATSGGHVYMLEP
jgi:outer membrane protein assembly factor BamB